MKNRIKITFGLLVICLLSLVFLQQLLRFDEMENKISDAREIRFLSALFAEELRRTSDELTREARIYAISSDPHARARYDEIIDIREGYKPREQVTDQGLVEVLTGAGVYVPVDGAPVGFMELARLAGFTTAEMATLEKAKQMSDGLFEVEYSAFDRLDLASTTPDVRMMALEMLVRDEYLTAKNEISEKIHEFERLVRDRVALKVGMAAERSTRIRMSLIALGLLLVGLIVGGLLVEESRASKYEGRARRDALTQVSNRAYLYEYLNKVTASAEAHGEIVLLAFIDLNGFKRINDQLGHKKGDELLKAVADSLHGECRAEDLVVRYGGDEFVIVFVSAMNQRRESISRMRETIESAFGKLGENFPLLNVGASVGMSVFPCPAASVDALIQNADDAMYSAKKTGQAVAICIHVEENGLACSCHDSVPFRMKMNMVLS